jgi:hypothetical protein
VRQGCSPKDRQIRCTDVGEMPTRRASSCFDQCVAPSGVSSRVRTTTSSTWASPLGSPGQATSTCQVLPAGFPGHQRYCPYTAGAKDGAWNGPDLAKAVRLARESGTTHVPVTVWNEQGNPAGAYLVHLLRQLGYQATLRVVPVDQLFATAANPQAGAMSTKRL